MMDSVPCRLRQSSITLRQSRRPGERSRFSRVSALRGRCAALRGGSSIVTKSSGAYERLNCVKKRWRQKLSPMRRLRLASLCAAQLGCRKLLDAEQRFSWAFPGAASATVVGLPALHLETVRIEEVWTLPPTPRDFDSSGQHLGMDSLANMSSVPHIASPPRASWPGI